MSEVLIFMQRAAELRALLDPSPPGVTVAVADDLAAALAQAADASVLVAMPFLVTRELIAAMPRLRWVQTATAGIDALTPLGLDPEILVTTSRGMHGPQISELIFLHMLAFTRDLRGMFARQAAREWAPSPQPILAGKRLVVLGLGAIAEALAARAQAFGMHVVGVSGSRDAAPGYDAVLPLSALRDAVGGADFFVVLTPLTPRTEGIVDADVIAALPARASLINVARGKVIDEPALIAALAAGRLRGAGLDVFATEPLSRESPLWGMENVIVTPHVAGWSDIFLEQLAPIVRDNLTRWFADPP
jgi:D-2-hydroxyacid dehydrogenase (NADP+)